MRQIFLILLFISYLSTTAFGQFRKPKSYALIIGVSTYSDPRITPLNYAHVDAQAFADFCLSPYGLSIPSDQVRTMTNENASYWNIVDGL
ncbi:MAG TPA: hypothetical protein PKD85_18605, partial [Saprospiraceae bacterium]|nr:hypothetical protein [Saprospiraceae bacterium]